MFPWDKNGLAQKKVFLKNVLIPWYPISFLTITFYGFFGGGAYGSLPDAAIWWCLRTGGGGVLTRVAFHVGSSHFFGIGIYPVSDTAGIGIFGRFYRGVGKFSSFIVWLSKNI